MFTIITLNSFSDRFPIFTSLSCFCGFLLFPSSRTFFSARSFCLLFCVCGLFSVGWRIIAPVASGFCHLVGKFGPEPCVVGRSDACPVVGTAGSCPTDEQDHVKGYV